MLGCAVGPGVKVSVSSDSGDRAAKIAASSVAALYARAPLALAVNIAVAALAIAIMRHAVASPLRYMWFGGVAAAIAGHALLCRRYAVARPASRDAAAWGGYFAAAAALSGVLWGCAAVLFFIPGAPVLQVFMMFVAGGIAAGALAALSPHVYAFYGFCLPVLLPLIAMLLLQRTETAAVMGATMGVFAASLCVLAYFLNRVQVRSFELRLENSRLADTLLDASAAAKSANLTRSAFLSTVSHELRTPLNAIIGFSEILKGEMFGSLGQPQYRDYVTVIHRSAEYLLNVINEILEISNAESGKIELQDEVVDVSRAVAICVSIISSHAGTNAPAITTRIAADLPLLHADSRRVRQILLNLLSNAVKFTPGSGRIEVHASRDAGGGLVIGVDDTGVGMTLAEIKNATELFSRIDIERSRKISGTGIGLPLTKALVELHGGELTVESRLGSGTRVTVRFPKERVLAG